MNGDMERKRNLVDRESRSIMEKMPFKKRQKKNRKKIKASDLGISHRVIQQYKAIAVLIWKLNLHTLIVQAPYLLRGTARIDLGGLLVQLAWERIKCCGPEGCPYIILKPLFSGIKRNDEWQVTWEFYLSLTDTAKRNHVMILSYKTSAKTSTNICLMGFVPMLRRPGYGLTG